MRSKTINQKIAYNGLPIFKRFIKKKSIYTSKKICIYPYCVVNY